MKKDIIYNDVYGFWASIQPDFCKQRGCECGYLTWDKEGNPLWRCELNVCYFVDSQELGVKS